MEPLPFLDVDLLSAPEGNRMMGQFLSLTDAIASLLGYELPAMTPHRSPSPKTAQVPPKAAPPSNADQKPTPMETGNSDTIAEEDSKPTAVTSEATAPKKNPMSFLDDDSSDDDSIPNAMVFGPKK